MRNSSSRRAGCIALTLFLLTAGCRASRAGYALAQAPPAPPTSRQAPDAPDFPASLQWLNTDHPVSLRDLRGKVVLLDFWTYCCINCMHIIPGLKALEAKYPNELAVIGVHSAKFVNERDAANIREAILRYDIEHPVVNDNQLIIWRMYGVDSWPTLVLIAPNGKVVGAVSGEGNMPAVDQAIAQLIRTFDARGELNRKPLHWALEKEQRPHSVLSYPGKITADANSNRLFFTDSDHNRIVVTSGDGAVQDVIGDGNIGLKDGDFSSAEFFRPQGLAYDAARDALYVADTENHEIRKVDFKTRKVTTLAGTGHQAAEYPPPGGVGTGVALSSPWDLTLVGNTLYIAMAGCHQLWTLDLNSLRAEPYAGTGRENIDDGLLDSASLAQPSGITNDGKLLYFADSEASAVREAPLGGHGEVRTIIGQGLFDYADVDGKYPTARLQHPIGIAWDGGFLYVADTYNHKIKRINPRTRVSETLIGTGRRGMADGPAKSASLNEPNGLTFAGGKMYIADTNNQMIRVYHPASGLVSTLKLTGLDKLTRQSDAPAFTGKEQRIPALAVSSEAKALTVTLHLPAGTHITPDAPLHVAASSASPDSVAVGDVSGIKPAATVTIPITPRSGESTVTVDLGVHYCSSGNGGLCYFKETRLVIPIRVTAGGATSPSVIAAL